MSAGNGIRRNRERLGAGGHIAHIHAAFSLHAANGAGDRRAGGVGAGEERCRCVDAELVEEGTRIIHLPIDCLAGFKAKARFQLTE